MRVTSPHPQASDAAEPFLLHVHERLRETRHTLEYYKVKESAIRTYCLLSGVPADDAAEIYERLTQPDVQGMPPGIFVRLLANVVAGYVQ